MAGVTPLSAYVGANILLVLAVALLGSVRAVSAVLPRPIAYRHQLRLGEAMALGTVLLPLAGSFCPNVDLLPQAAEVWSAPTMDAAALSASEEHRLAVSFSESGTPLPLDGVRRAVLVLFLAGLLWGLVRLALDARATLAVIADAHTIRQCGSSRVLASERLRVPFSFWLPARHFIVVPCSLLSCSRDLLMAIRHEAQHHRQHDTKCVYLQQLLEAAFFWNPAVRWLSEQLRELREFSCDEALGARRNVPALDYCRCLLRVAEAAAHDRRGRIHASMIGGAAGLLRRRIEAILERPTRFAARSVVWGAAGCVSVLMATTTLALSSTIRDRRISAEEAHRMTLSAQAGGALAITANDRVVEQLNVLLSTPDGRAYLRASLGRMRSHEAFIADQLELHGMPRELLAVPLVESGYRNLPQGADAWRGAGLWMFIASTARQFGLTVDAGCDERMDVAAETAAAIRLLASLHRRFDDWGLALLAYNIGSDRVERAIQRTGSRDVWKLIAERGRNADYVPRVMAVMLILKNLTVLN